eukprot:m.72847 g.72847  ORF g.72847 m.72847 type:complete len:389 (+) comp13871_c0_seq1:131-1297(+)
MTDAVLACFLKALQLPAARLRATVFGCIERPKETSTATEQLLAILYKDHQAVNMREQHLLQEPDATASSGRTGTMVDRKRQIPQSAIDRLLNIEDDTLARVLPDALDHQRRITRTDINSSGDVEDNVMLDNSINQNTQDSKNSNNCTDQAVQNLLNKDMRWPLRPLAHHLAVAIYNWALEGQAPSHQPGSAAENVLQSMQQQEDLIVLAKPRSLSRPCSELRSTLAASFLTTNEAATVDAFDQLLCKATTSDLQWFLGMQRTVGTIDALPPLLRDLVQAFQAPNTPGGPSILTQGARAHSKHCHRDSTDCYWGVPSGSEHQKNALAKEVLCRLLTTATWMNTHCFSARLEVFELRTARGYGARWSKDGKFRGFLEPQAQDGHLVGWRH